MVMTASFNSARLFITTICLLLFSLQLSRRSSTLVTADATSFIQNLCSQTLELNACKNCMASHPTEDIPELIYSVLFCMCTQAVYGHNQADEISRTATSAGVNRALGVCSDTLSAALNNLSDAVSMVGGSEYRDAFMNMKKSRRSLILCGLAFRRFATGDGDVIPAFANQ